MSIFNRTKKTSRVLNPAPQLKIYLYKQNGLWFWQVRTGNNITFLESVNGTQRRTTARKTIKTMISLIRSNVVELHGDGNTEGPTRV